MLGLVILCLVYFLLVMVWLCNQLPGKTRLRHDLLCVEWDVKPYTLSHEEAGMELLACWLKEQSVAHTVSLFVCLLSTFDLFSGQRI